MDAQKFLDNFGTVAEAPGGVQRLREFTLALALAGKLVEQSGGDEPAGIGLEAVRAEKDATLADSIRGGGSVRRIPSLSERTEELPRGWEWARVDDTGRYINGLAFKNSDWKPSGTPIIRIQNLTNPELPFNYADGPFPRDRMAYQGDILVSWSATLDAFRWNRGEAVVNQHIFKVVPDNRVVTPDYLFYLLKHCIRAMAETEAAHGLVMKHINRGPFLTHVVALPPLAEQERIVTKLDELMRSCDVLEPRQACRDQVITRFRTSALQVLTQAKSPREVRAAWERIATNWPVLANSSAAAGTLRDAVAELAVAGRLTSRLAGDGTADDLLRSTGDTALDDPDLVDSEGVIISDPHPLPPTWRWVVLGSLVTDVLAGWSAPSTQERRSGGEWAVLKVSACTWGSFRPDENKALAPGAAPREELEVRQGDLLITRANTSDLVARSVVVDSTPPRLMLSDKTLRLTPIHGCNPRYLNLANLAPVARAHYRAEATGTSDSMRNVSQRAIRRTPIPLPPTAEQDRIVAAVDRLHGLCNDLAGALNAHAVAAERLANAATA